jgi:type I restriction enzyme S subunit
MPTKQVDPVFTAYLMHSSFVLQHAIATTSGVNHPRTSWKALSQALIPLPPLPEQQEIARILQTVDRKLEAEEARKQALEALFKTLLHDLMTAQRRLPRELVARFEGDSPASQREHQEGTP